MERLARTESPTLAEANKGVSRHEAVARSTSVPHTFPRIPLGLYPFTCRRARTHLHRLTLDAARTCVVHQLDSMLFYYLYASVLSSGDVLLSPMEFPTTHDVRLRIF